MYVRYACTVVYCTVPVYFSCTNTLRSPIDKETKEICELHKHYHYSTVDPLISVVDRNDLLLFRFRLKKCLFRFRIQKILSTVFQQQKLVQNLAFSLSEAASFDYKVDYSFLIFRIFLLQFMLDPDPNPVPKPEP
jgi:hypothetical protein